MLECLAAVECLAPVECLATAIELLRVHSKLTTEILWRYPAQPGLRADVRVSIEVVQDAARSRLVILLTFFGLPSQGVARAITSQ